MWRVFGVGLIGLLLIGGSSKVLARNVRNNNPLNVEYREENPWLGQVGSDGRFAKFQNVSYGFRVGAMLIRKYQAAPPKGYGLLTLRGIITRWAPPSENDTEAYIRYVSKASGIAPEQEIILSQNPALFARVLHAMSKMEGENDYTIADARSGVVMA